MSFFKNLFRKQRLPFITGSAAYGQHYRDPKTSDVDIVLLVSEETMEILRPFVSELSKILISQYGGAVTGARIKAGDIDLILTTSEKDYDHWKRVTGTLKKKQPTSRQDAVNAFKEDKGLPDYDYDHYHEWVDDPYIKPSIDLLDQALRRVVKSVPAKKPKPPPPPPTLKQSGG